MTRKKGRKEPVVIQDKISEKECVSLLPLKDLFRIDEVAAYFSVTERTIRLWIAHGHLVSEKINGIVRVSRDSILLCRLKK